MKYIFIVFTLIFSSVTFATETTFIFAHINEAVMPIKRGEKYEDPLDTFLKSQKIGEVTGGGSSLSKSGQIEWVGVDIELVNPRKNLPTLIKKLRELGAPKGSFLEFTLNKQNQKKIIW